MFENMRNLPEDTLKPKVKFKNIKTSKKIVSKDGKIKCKDKAVKSLHRIIISPQVYS